MNKLTITDQDGNVIEVADHDQALMQAKAFKKEALSLTYAIGRNFAEKQRIYWQDIHDKLIQLKNKL